MGGRDPIRSRSGEKPLIPDMTRRCFNAFPALDGLRADIRARNGQRHLQARTQRPAERFIPFRFRSAQAMIQMERPHRVSQKQQRPQKGCGILPAGKRHQDSFAGCQHLVRLDRVFYDFQHGLLPMDSVWIGKRCILTDPLQLHRVGGAVSVFGNNNFRYVLLLRFVIIIIVTINKHDDIRVLLDRTGFAQIGQHRPLIRALFGRA